MIEDKITYDKNLETAEIGDRIAIKKDHNSCPGFRGTIVAVDRTEGGTRFLSVAWDKEFSEDEVSDYYEGSWYFLELIELLDDWFEHVV